MQNLLGYTLALWWLEVTFFLFWGENWWRNKQQGYIENSLSFSRDSQLLLWKDWSCTFAWDEEKDSNSTSHEQWFRTEKDILFASVSRQAVSLFCDLLYQDAGARCPKPFQEAKNRCNLYFGRAQAFLSINFAEVSLPPGTLWLPILHHVQLWLQEWPHALVRQRQREEAREEKEPFLFITRAVGLWTQLPLGWITNRQPTPGVFWLLTRQEGQQNTGDFRKHWGQNQSMGLGCDGHTHHLCNKLPGAGLMIGHWQTKSGHSGCFSVQTS